MGKGERKGDWGMGVWKKNGESRFTLYPIPYTPYPYIYWLGYSLREGE
jgi:hypothetical protein